MLSKTANLSSTLHKKEPLLRVVAFFSTTPKPQDLQERISEAKSRIGSINNFGENLAATTHQKFTGRNRFYKEVSVVPVDEKNSKVRK